MENLKQILIDHARKYPLMEPTDAVKLIYQNEFGGGHLIRDEESCMAYLHREYESTVQTENGPLAEDIGNGFVRVFLNGLDAHSYAVTQLGADFIRSAAVHRGTLDSFLLKLDVLRQLTREGSMPFSPAVLESYLDSYKAAGYPMVSHSSRYRAAYHPAYRIVLGSFTESLPQGYESFVDRNGKM